MNIFLPIIFSICFGCSKEPSHWDGSFEYTQHMFWLRNKKIISYLKAWDVQAGLRFSDIRLSQNRHFVLSCISKNYKHLHLYAWKKMFIYIEKHRDFTCPTAWGSCKYELASGFFEPWILLWIPSLATKSGFLSTWLKCKHGDKKTTPHVVYYLWCKEVIDLILWSNQECIKIISCCHNDITCDLPSGQHASCPPPPTSPLPLPKNRNTWRLIRCEIGYGMVLHIYLDRGSLETIKSGL